MIQILHYLKDPNYGNDGLYFLFWGNAGFIPSTAVFVFPFKFLDSRQLQRSTSTKDPLKEPQRDLLQAPKKARKPGV